MINDMTYGLMADLVLIVHLVFIIFVVCGGLLVLRNDKWMWLHIPAVIWGAVVEFTGWYCPLTPLENWLRLRQGAGAYADSFVGHYLVPIIYPAGLTRGLQVALGAGVVVINLLVYAFVIYRRHRFLKHMN